jgi:hypothetical protein
LAGNLLQRRIHIVSTKRLVAGDEAGEPAERKHPIDVLI